MAVSRLAQIKRQGQVKRAPRIMIYGIEGVGKTSFAAKAPNPIFIGPEGGVDQIPGAVEMPGIRTWTDLRDAVRELITGEHDFKTVVLDSADWIEKLCHAHIIGSTGRSIITCNGGYGAGYRESEKLHRELIEDLSLLRERRNMGVIVTAHYHVRTVKDPEAVADYDAFEIKCHEFVSSLWREWVDCLLFARFKTHVKPGSEDNEKVIAMGTSERVVYTEKRPAFQAKNRYGLPPEMDFTKDFYSQLMAAMGSTGSADPESLEQIKKDLEELYEKVTDETTKKAVYDSIAKAGTDSAQLLKIRNKLRKVTAA